MTRSEFAEKLGMAVWIYVGVCQMVGWMWMLEFTDFIALATQYRNTPVGTAIIMFPVFGMHALGLLSCAGTVKLYEKMHKTSLNDEVDWRGRKIG